MNKRLLLRIITILFAVGTFSPSIMAATNVQKAKTGPITYQEIGDAYISSFGIVEIQEPEMDQNKKKLDLTIPVLSEHEKRQILFEIMARNEKITQGDNLIDDALRITLSDLDVYFGNGKDTQETLMNELSHTDTIFGDVELAHLLAHPLADVSLIQKRQALIKAFVENPELACEVKHILDQVKNAESGFLSFWRENDPVSEKLFKDLYFSKPGLKNYNDNKYALEALVRVGNLGTALKTTYDFWVAAGIRYVVRKKNLIPTFGPESILDSIKGTAVMGKNIFINGLNPVAYWKGYKEMNTPEWEERMLDANPNLTAENLPLAKRGALIGMAIVPVSLISYLTFRAYQAKGVLQQAAQTKDSINYLHTKLIDVATVVDACKQISALAQNNSVIADGVLSIDAIEQMLHGPSRTIGFAELIDLLQTNTFKGSASFFSLSGRVLAANRLMIEEKDQFASALAALGEIDACLSMAKLYKKMKREENVGYCFAQFVQKEKPYLNLVNFWNPFIDPKKVVVNSIELGDGADASKVILTGSNTGGKSTILKAMMIDLVLLHTFGIAAAEQATLTPFAFIGSYLRVNDDTASGESKFKAEVLRAKMLCETMDSLKAHQFGFVVIDELFTGTSSANAANAAAKVALKLAGLENNLYILATHFPSMTDLEKDHTGIIKNYKVDIYKDQEGNLVRPFKLEIGVSANNVANDILNEEIKDIDFGI